MNGLSQGGSGLFSKSRSPGRDLEGVSRALVTLEETWTRPWPNGPPMGSSHSTWTGMAPSLDSIHDIPPDVGFLVGTIDPWRHLI